MIAVLGPAAFVWLAVRGFRYEDIASVLASAKPWPWLPLAVASYVAGHLARGYRCKLLVQRDARLTVGAASNIVVAGYAGNNVLPARLGEIVRAGMLVSRTGVPLVQALTMRHSNVCGLGSKNAPKWTRDPRSIRSRVRRGRLGSRSTIFPLQRSFHERPRRRQPTRRPAARSRSQRHASTRMSWVAHVTVALHSVTGVPLHGSGPQ